MTIKLNMFDTHCHLNFSAFKNNLDEIINNAKKEGVDSIVIPGTDYESSKRAVEIAEKYEGTTSPERSRGIYAAVGIHPHHVFEIKERCSNDGFCEPLQLIVVRELKKIEELLVSEKVVTIGEIGIDRHIYQKTKYSEYIVDEAFIEYQKAFLKAQINLAIEHDKSVILHNREAKKDILEILTDYRLLITENRCVFHCCEPDQELLDFAIKRHIFIGVDGDITYRQDKQEFIKKVPLELLVLETDSPFLLPEPLRSQKKYPNEPANLPIIAKFIAQLKNIPVDQLTGVTTENAKRLFLIRN